jgi:hypothetical protein
MELFIEKEFLEDFEIDSEKNPIKEVVKNIITNYGDKQVFINYDEKDFVQLKNEYEFFALICNTTVPIPVSDIKESVKKSNFLQTLVFTKKEENWFEEIENKGALCFSFDNYEQKIKIIIDNLHFRIDLSEQFNGWSFLDVFKTISYNKIIVTDGYVLVDSDGQKMEENIIPILKKLSDACLNNISITFFTKELKPISNQAKYIREKAKKRIKKFDSLFANINVKFKIINSSLNFGIDLHDRNIATNFSLLDSGKGLNLIPYKNSNSQIISETIFEKYTYNRLNSILRQQNKYIEKLNKLETLEFTQYP